MLREAVSLTYALITVLIFLFSYTWGDDLWTKHERDCAQANVYLLEHQMEGPLRACPSN